jgi:hypothetical protein
VAGTAAAELGMQAESLTRGWYHVARKLRTPGEKPFATTPISRASPWQLASCQLSSDVPFLLYFSLGLRYAF